MLVLIRGAGDLASGIALRLHRAGFSIVMTETAQPTTVRRTVAFSDAVPNGSQTVEGITALRAETREEACLYLEEGSIPVLVDPDCACRDACPCCRRCRHQPGLPEHDASGSGNRRRG